jgi:hypothetical protein
MDIAKTIKVIFDDGREQTFSKAIIHKDSRLITVFDDNGETDLILNIDYLRSIKILKQRETAIKVY